MTMKTMTIQLPDFRQEDIRSYDNRNQFYDNLPRLVTLHDRALQVGVNWQLQFWEAEGNWEVELTSAVQGESLSMRDSPLLEVVLDKAIAHLDALIQHAIEWQAEQARIAAQTVLVEQDTEYVKQRALMAIRVAALCLYPPSLQKEFRTWWTTAGTDFSCHKKVAIPVPFSDPIIEPYDLVERTHQWLDDHDVGKR